MSKLINSAGLIVLYFLANTITFAQNNYYMSNDYVKDCKGFLFDSDNHPSNPGQYAHNEDFTFTICPDNVNSIDVFFTSFCTEASLDILRIYAGTDTNAALIGQYSGTSIPPPFNTSGCITFHFKSDANVSCSGWELFWTAQVDPPPPPQLSLQTALTCSLNQLIYDFSFLIHCDTIEQSFWEIQGPESNIITPLSLNCINDSSTQVQLDLSSGLNKSGTYIIRFVGNFIDACDSVWTLEASDTFVITDCPLIVDIEASDSVICLGECTEIFAKGYGGDSLNYSFSWSNSLPSNAGPHSVCPINDSYYTVTLTDGSASPAAIDTIFISVNYPSTLSNDTTVCQSEGAFFVLATPSGGHWEGNGLTDSINGIFDPDSGIAGANILTHTNNIGCKDSITVTIMAIDAGPDESTCPSTDTIQLSGNNPLGGTWSGDSVLSNGLFTGSDTGTYIVYYTYNSCIDTKIVSVAPINMPTLDSVCMHGKTYLNATPPGGVWSGIGITDSLLGEYKYWKPDSGMNTLYYTINGCIDSVSHYLIYSKNGPPEYFCNSQDSVFLQPGKPSGGIWYGQGVIDSVNGYFDPSQFNNGKNLSLYYITPQCSARKNVFIRNTMITYDSLYFCPESDSFSLDNQSILAIPFPGFTDGILRGPGITDSTYPGWFNPNISGPGIHKIYYDINTCMDSMYIFVDDSLNLTDTIVCELSPPFQLQSANPGGIWQGIGITDSLLGTFDPGIVGIDTVMIRYTSPYGCRDSTTIGVYAIPVLAMDTLPNQICFNDTNMILVATPSGGTFSGNGVTGNIFNPLNAGTGLHQISYSYGSGSCLTTTSQYIIIGDTLSVELITQTDTICQLDGLDIEAIATGGIPANYHFSWNQGLSSQSNHHVYPSTTTLYSVTITDACSQDSYDSALIYVHPGISAYITTSDTLCYGEIGTAKATMNSSGDYLYEWDTDPLSTDSSINALVGLTYTITITDANTGCSIIMDKEIPSYDKIQAFFMISPDGCVPSYDAQVDLIDLSQGASNGLWDLGDGSSETYEQLNNPRHTYSDTGIYLVSLYVINDGGCTDSVTREVCIEAVSRFFVPNAFSPNGDGINDEFKVISHGVTEFEMQIFNRWGEVLFQTKDPDIGWDGTYDGEVAPQGTYIFRLEYKLIDKTYYKPHIERGYFILLNDKEKK